MAVKNFTDYDEYIHSEAWSKKRQERLRIDGFKCQRCGATEKLEVHHVTYNTLGNENMNDLITLCELCHTKIHAVDSLSWCLKHKRYPNKGVEIWAKKKMRRGKKSGKSRGKKL